MLSRDKELPHAFAGLNRFGMPVLPLVIASVVPAVVVLIFPDVTALSGLYAIGVVGAIAINLGTTSTNRALPLRTYERGLMLVLTVVMIAIEATICIVKPEARGFALIVLVAGLSARLGTIASNRAVPLTMRQRRYYLAVAFGAVVAEVAVTVLFGHDVAGVRGVVPGRLWGRLRQLSDAELSRGADRAEAVPVPEAPSACR